MRELPPLTAAELAEHLASYRFNYTSERDLQDGIEQALQEAEVSYEREAPLGLGRIDFLVGDVGIEVKIDGGDRAVLRQLQRYANHEEISELLLVTSRVRHQPPELIEGKPCRTLSLAFGGL
jgi:hypothetical protein